ncbi:MAG: hypothetical protein IKZ58_08625 [Selenomonadaceae bacterium]|nr:hypothetical protein [Selenomonadaceae bacterium]
MKIIDATWEKRNLGVTCYEIEFSNEDKLSDIESNREKFFERQYVVLKVPNNRADISAYVQSQGAKYIESLITFQCDLRNWKLPDSLKDLCALSSYAPMNDDDIEVMFSEIRKGIFKTDRVYLDPYFTKEQAAQRYVNWSKDMLKQGYTPYKILYQGVTVGFYLHALAGVYSKFLGTGMGMFVQYACIDSSIKAGRTKAYAVVSSNNPEVVNIRIKLGCQIKSTNYIFVMHND